MEETRDWREIVDDGVKNGASISQIAKMCFPFMGMQDEQRAYNLVKKQYYRVTRGRASGSKVPIFGDKKTSNQKIQPQEGVKSFTQRENTDVFGHTLAALQNMQQGEAFPKEWADEYVCFALLFHDIGKPSVRTTDADGYDHFYGHPKISAEITDKILRERLRCSNEFRKTVVELVEHHDVTFSPTKACVRRMLNKFGVEQLHRLLKLRECDNRAHTPAAYPLFEDAMKFAEQVDIVLAEEAAFSLKDLAVKGKDLVAAGFEPGPRMGRILSALLEAVISEKVPNEKGELIEYAKRRSLDV